MSDLSSKSGISFFQKAKTNCPACNQPFHREELLTGRGRLIAGNLTKELRRLYEPSKKFGTIQPLNYPVTVCPNCYFAAWKEDFLKLPDKFKQRAVGETDDRIKLVGSLLPGLDFTSPRTVQEGLASYLLALHCYDYYTKDSAPVIKQGISALRAAWLAVDLHKEDEDQNFAYLAKILYKKAAFFYSLGLEYEQNGKQSLGGCPNLGPDQDKNYGYDGVIYLAGYLEYNFGPDVDQATRRARLEKSKRAVARIFGMGKASKNKPQAILDNARELYNQINETLGILDADPEKDAQES